MLSRRNVLWSTGGALLTGSALSYGTNAQATWPSKEIHIISASPPGTGGDSFSRFYGKKLEEALGKPVIVEYRLGAFGNIANEYVARSRPDGYTIYLVPANLLAIAPHLFTKLNYDPVKDFEHITTLLKIPFVLAVAGDGAYKSVSDLVVDLKTKGDKASYGSVSSVSLLSGELFKAQFGLNTVEVKYKEPQAGIADLLGGNLAFVYTDAASSIGQLKSGKLRGLAVTTKERLGVLKDIPGSEEVGIANTDIFSWWTLNAPRGTPKAILDRLEAIFNKTNSEANTKTFLANIGAEVFPGDAALAHKLIVEGVKKWGEYVKLAKIEPIS